MKASIFPSAETAGVMRQALIEGELTLVGAVVIHGPDLFHARPWFHPPTGARTGAVGDEIDLGAGKALAAELRQNVGGVFARDFRGPVFIQRADVAFGEQTARCAGVAWLRL